MRYDVKLYFGSRVVAAKSISTKRQLTTEGIIAHADKMYRLSVVERRELDHLPPAKFTITSKAPVVNRTFRRTAGGDENCNGTWTEE